MHIDGVGKIYTATGNVHYVQADTTVDADNGVLNDLTHDLDLTGNVKIVQGDRNMVANHVLYNTISGQAHAEGDVVDAIPQCGESARRNAAADSYSQPAAAPQGRTGSFAQRLAALAMDSLFGEPDAPLAARMRPRSLEEFVGQGEIVGEGRALRRAIESDRVPSMILWGPPGNGKDDAG